MPTLKLPRYQLLRRLFDLVAEAGGALLPCCRWLVHGPGLAAILGPDEPPTLEQVTALLRLLRSQAPELLETGLALVRKSEHGDDAYVEICVDLLLETPDWQHPTQVLEPPRPDFPRLLEASLARRRPSHVSSSTELDAVIEKLERAVRIAENARKRRARMDRGPRRR